MKLRNAALTFAICAALVPPMAMAQQAPAGAGSSAPMSQSGRAAWEASLRGQYQLFEIGELGLALDVQPSGVKVVSLYDLARQRELLAAQNEPLFGITVRKAENGEGVSLDATSGWKSVELKRSPEGFGLTFSRDDAGGPMTVDVQATFDNRESAVSWEFSVRKPARDAAPVTWSVANVAFPQVTLADMGANMRAFVPRGAGKVFTSPFTQKLSYNDTYGNGSCTMQFMAAYDESPSPTGLYVAREDPFASHKKIHSVADEATKTVKLWFDQPIENPMTPGNGAVLTGTGVWKLLRGDWFDAAQHYKSFVQAKANWWPKLTDNGREDTPLWYRQLDVWLVLAAKSDEVRGDALQFRREMGVPVGFHWYLWHSNPFDNDYPHFFPAIPGFKETMTELQKAGLRVTPYMNGRLWDTRDKGLQDWQYSKIAVPATAKNLVDGKLVPQTENYFGHEADGSDIYLGVMCPATKLWQDTLVGLVSRMTKQEGSDGVYLDQIGAIGAVECMDPTHGHPLGGGHWWVDGYHQLLERTRKEMRPGTIITTECNTEPYVKYLDGYLTLHWQDNGQVPAFPAIYGGAVQMFGRLYTGVKDLNVRMKAGQQLVYGEQIGWVREDMHLKSLNALSRDYFRDVVQIRNKIHEYMYAGEMRRPPRFDDKLPTVTADWNYGSGEITTDSILTGAWKKRGANRMVLIFTNVSDKEINSPFTFRPEAYGVSNVYRITRWTNADLGSKTSFPARTQSGTQTQKVTMNPASTQVWEIEWN